MPAAQQRNQHFINHMLLPHDHLAHFRKQPLPRRGEQFDNLAFSKRGGRRRKVRRGAHEMGVVSNSAHGAKFSSTTQEGKKASRIRRPDPEGIIEGSQGANAPWKAHPPSQL